jgi:hypothetical protein
MPIDASIPLGVHPFQVESPVNQLAKVLQLQGAQQENQLGRMKMDEYQRGVDDQNYLRSALAIPDADPYKVLLQRGKVKEATEFAKGKADILKSGAETDAKNIEVAHKRVDIMGQTLGWVRQNPTAENAAQAVQYLVQNGVMPADKGQEALAKFQADPSPQAIAAFADMGFRAALQAKDQLPKLQTNNIGGQTVTQQMDPVSGKVLGQTALQNTQSPDNAATNATHIQGIGMTNATSRANNRDTIAAENLRAGVVPGGGMDENSERTAQAIASGQLPAPTGMALLNPKNQRILGRVMEINPNYDATTVSAKKTAAAAFTSGPLGNALRSVSTANAHLDQLNELVDAMGNGNTQVVNKVQNYFSKATGSPNVTNFEAIKAIVGQEVVKAIVSGGGGVGEREEAAKIFSSASSPAQLKGAIQHYRMVMGAQANNLMEQRRAAGLPDSTLPNYSTTNNTPQGMPDHSAIDAELARRAGKK